MQTSTSLGESKGATVFNRSRELSMNPLCTPVAGSAAVLSLASNMLVFLVGARIYELFAAPTTAMSIEWTAQGGAR
ncbi:MAG: hypothetical protein V4636_02595 [Pseudomonadota bacterium]